MLGDKSSGGRAGLIFEYVNNLLENMRQWDPIDKDEIAVKASAELGFPVTFQDVKRAVDKFYGRGGKRET